MKTSACALTMAAASALAQTDAVRVPEFAFRLRAGDQAIPVTDFGKPGRQELRFKQCPNGLAPQAAVILEITSAEGVARVTTEAAHGLSTNQVAAIGGQGEFNGPWRALVESPTSFLLAGSSAKEDAAGGGRVLRSYRHFLYLEDGPASEVVPVTGGSCAGPRPGTVEIVTAQPHDSSGWFLASATDGAKEAVEWAIRNNGAAVYFPPGSYLFRAPLAVTASGVTLTGSRGASYINATNDTGFRLPDYPLIEFTLNGGELYSATVSNLSFDTIRGAPYFYSADYATPCDMITGCHAVLRFNRVAYGLVEDVFIGTAILGIDVTGGVLTRIERVDLHNTQPGGGGIRAANTGVQLRRIDASGSPASFEDRSLQPRYGVLVRNAEGLEIDTSDFIAHGTGLWVRADGGTAQSPVESKHIFLSKAMFDTGGGDGILLEAAGENDYIQTVQIGDSWMSNNHGFGLRTSGNVRDLSIINTQIKVNGRTGVQLETGASQVRIANNTIQCNGLDLASYHRDGIRIGPHVREVVLTGNYLGNNQRVGNAVYATQLAAIGFVTPKTNDDLLISANWMKGGNVLPQNPKDARNSVTMWHPPGKSKTVIIMDNIE